MANHIIETFDLSKVYKLKGQNKKITALDKVNLSVKEGEKFGLLGPNGAGKTTMIHILTTLKNPLQAKSRVALMLESSMLYHRITGYDNLKFFCKIYNVPNYKEKINKIIKEFGLEKWLNQYVYNFSSGMKMKLALCRTFLLGRKILFLDEPTLGLDVNTVSFIINKIRNIKNTVFLTSHDMNVVENVCDRIAFIDEGKILKIGTKADIAKLIQTEIKVDIEIFENKNKLKTELNQQEFIIDVVDTKRGFIITIIDRDYYKDLFLILSNYHVLGIKELELSLKDLYLNIF